MAKKIRSKNCQNSGDQVGRFASNACSVLADRIGVESCVIALMTVGTRQSEVASAEIWSTWAQVEDDAPYCLQDRIIRSQGGVIITKGESLVFESEERGLNIEGFEELGVFAL